MKLPAALLFLCLFASGVLAQAPQKTEPKLFLPKKAQDGRRVFGWPVSGGKVAGLALVAVGGLCDGFLQGYEFDGRHYFERNHGADPYGFWGSLSWQDRYAGRNKANGLASPLYRHLPVVDFFHAAKTAQHYTHLTGAAVLGLEAMRLDRNWKHFAADFAAMFIINSLAERAGLKWARS